MLNFRSWKFIVYVMDLIHVCFPHEAEEQANYRGIGVLSRPEEQANGNPEELHGTPIVCPDKVEFVF
jgi:hypothetical protein